MLSAGPDMLYLFWPAACLMLIAERRSVSAFDQGSRSVEFFDTPLQKIQQSKQHDKLLSDIGAIGAALAAGQA